jgi:voltage-gated potassium channel
MQNSELPPAENTANQSIRERLWRIIFRSDTPAGRRFDVVLLWLVFASVIIVMIESVPNLRAEYGAPLRIAEWTFTLLFTLEYLVRIAVVQRPLRYMSSFFGIVDLLSILPTYVELLLVGTQYFLVLRVLRLLRMFRVLKMAHYLNEAGILINALRASQRKIFVFLFTVLALVCVEGTIMYLIENASNPGFSSIPQSIYWSIVTVTTVGYGDVSPVTVLGKMMASVVMLTGFAIIAVPTGVVTAEIGLEMIRARDTSRRCQECGWQRHDTGARYCQQCGTSLETRLVPAKLAKEN